MKNLHIRPALLCILLAGGLVVSAQPGGWSVRPADFQFSMNMVVQIEKGGTISPAADNHIAAFSGSQIRGYGTPVMVSGQAYFFLTLYANAYVGEKLYFQTFIGAENKVYESVDSVDFLHNNLIGSLAQPQVLHFNLSARPLIFSLANVPYDESNCTPAVIDVQASDDVDTEGNGLKYSKIGGADSSRFKIDSLTGVLSWNNFTPDFENPLDSDFNNTYLVRIRVKDSAGNSSTQDITVQVQKSAPPTASCPPAALANTTDDNPGNCSTTIAASLAVTVPVNCSVYPVSYTLEGATTGQGNGQLPANQAFQRGQTVVRYTVTDEVGTRSSACSFTITVTDNEPPAVGCPGNKSVNLISGCSTAAVGTAATATDNCGFQLSYALSGATTATGTGQVPANQLFQSGLTTVTYTAVDSSSLQAQCSFSVTVHETAPPQVTCPANTNLSINASCTVSLPAYAAAQVQDNCTPAAAIAVSQAPAVGTLLSSLGPLSVQLTATDLSGNTATCSFTVTVVDTRPLLITCPPAQQVCAGLIGDYTALATVSNTCSPPAQISVTQNPPVNTAIPAYNGVLSVVLTAVDGPRTANCSFNVSWTDLIPPAAHCKNASTNLAANGQATIGINDIENGSTDNCGVQGLALNTTAFTCANLGANTVTLTATDVHGLTATCTATVTVQDIIPPTISCPANKTVTPTMTNPCSAIVNAINAVYNDNCPASAGLAYVLSGATTASGSGQASGKTFLTGVTTVRYTVTDAVNLSSSCTFTVTVGSCTTEFSGTIKWEQDTLLGVNTATVSLSGAASGSAVTSASGNFQIVLPYLSGNFTLTPAKNINKLNGVTTADVTAIQQHVANIALLPGPFKRIAADPNKSNTITATDASLLNQALLGSQSALNQITSWRFVPASYTFPNPNVPWGFPEQITLTGVGGILSGQNFKGIKLGDVVSTWANPANFGAGEPLVWRVRDQVLEAGQELEAEFRADQLDDLASFQFALRFDPGQLALLAIEPLDGLPVTLDNFGTYHLPEGEIRVVWAQAQGMRLPEAASVFRLRFRALQTGVHLSDVLQLDDPADTELPGHVYNSAYAESGVELRFGQSTTVYQPDERIALVARPNPFSLNTTLSFRLPAATEAQLRVTDVLGRVSYSRRKSYAAGLHEETLHLEGVKGVLYAELITEWGRVVRKIVAD